MSKSKYAKDFALKACKNKMTIKNLSKKKFKVTIEVLEDEPLDKDDLQITVHGGDWSVELKSTELWLSEIVEGDKETGYLTHTEGPINAA